MEAETKNVRLWKPMAGTPTTKEKVKMRNQATKTIEKIVVAIICLGMACASSLCVAEQTNEQHRAQTVTPPVAEAARQDVRLGEIVVTAERFPVNEITSTRSVEVFDSERLKATEAANLSEALRETAGSLSYKAFGPEGVSHGGMNSQFSIRGMRGGELVLFNGMPVQSAAGGGYNLDTLSLGQVNRVEVLKGAGSALYGADAESGVINIITGKRRPEKPYRLSLDLGENDSIVAGGGWSGEYLDLDASYRHLGGQREISRNFSRKYHYDTTPLDRLGFGMIADFGDGLQLDVLGGGYGIGWRKVADSGKLMETSDQDYYWNFADVRLEREQYNLKTFFSWGQMDYKRLNSTTPDSRNVNVQSGLKGDYRYTLGILEQTFGADYVYRAADYNQQYGYHYRNDVAALTEVKLTPWDPLVVTVGAREQFVAADSNGSDYDRFLPCAGANLRLADGAHVFANSGKAFRAPTFNQMYYESDFFVGNPDLGPEQGWTHETGLKLDTAMIRSRVALFYMDYSDKIVYDPSVYPITQINADSFTSIGVDWDVSVRPFLESVLAPVAFQVSGYWCDPTAETAAGVKSQSGDRFQIAPGMSYETSRWKGGVRIASAAGRERDVSSYCTVNLNAAVAFHGGWLKAGVVNLTDEAVMTSGNMTDVGTRYAYYGTPRMITVGYEIAF